MLTSVELSQRLEWPGVDEEVFAEYGFVYLYVRPTRAGLEPVYFCLNEDRTFVVQFGFGEWHCHPHEVADAVETAQLLVRGEVCVVEERDAAGKYRAGGLHAPGGLPRTLLKDAASLRRVFFDREPVSEPIDFTRYFRGKHIWLSHEHKTAMERGYIELGMQVPDW